MAKSKYGFNSLKRAAPKTQNGNKTRDPRDPLLQSLPVEYSRSFADDAEREEEQENRDATVAEEERYSGIAKNAPIFLSPEEFSAVRLFRKRVKEIAMVEPLTLGSSEKSIADYWIKGCYSTKDVDASVMAYIRYVGLAIVRREKV